MAEPLKNYFGPEIPEKIAGMISAVHPGFPQNAFLSDALKGYEDLELTPRAEHIAKALRSYLPEDYAEATRILISSMGPPLEKTEGNGMAPFLYSPYDFFIRDYGLEHFRESMDAIHEITQRFTSESSIRPFLIQRTEETLDQLRIWVQDLSVHVRRLVSEGTRPLLPWAPRIQEFRKNPAPVLDLLEDLKDDSELYVRRSVANNLNDIGKDNPAVLTSTAARWMKDASKERKWLIRHALRSAVKAMNPDALAVLGYGKTVGIELIRGSIEPKRVAIGEAVEISFLLNNSSPEIQHLLVDFNVHYIKASGKSSAKVFKLKEVSLGPGEQASFRKKLSVKNMTTRKHYPGRHRVEIAINGVLEPLGHFDLTD